MMRRAVVTRCSGQCKPVAPAAPGGRGGRGGGSGRGGRGGRGRGQQVNEQQVSWDVPLRDNPCVAVIGGGLSGLVCAQALARRGVRADVFDTGEHTVGGRLATRSQGAGSLRAEWVPRGLEGAKLAFDHAAQFFTATDPRFQALVDKWLAAGVVREWAGPVGTWRAGAAGAAGFEPLPEGGPRRYVAAGGMAALAEHLASPGGKAERLMEVRRPMWVARASAAPAGWQLTGNNKSQGVYDAVVIAHNGKCANRLAAPTGAPLVARQLMRLKLSALWALMVAFPEPLPAPFEGAFIAGSPVLSWAANNTAKLGLEHPGHPGLQCWTLLSTGAYGRANKVPQEAVPQAVAERVRDEMLAALGKALGAQLPQPLAYRCQLWGAALPTNALAAPCILDPAARFGVCGDWLAPPGGAAAAAASLQAAALSGLALAERLAALRGAAGAERDALAVGLHEPFAPVANPDIGGFPGAKAPPAADGGAAGGGARRQEAAPARQGRAGGGGGGGRGGAAGNGGAAGGLRRPERPPQPTVAA
ncbi:MAG: hypothetical protein J3K34DRAFT_527354 [Monoraphidium minutum]|nr:MAG: hypothetical protein J3K34DRAFT_527354 [Monoraphidium minutum]